MIKISRLADYAVVILAALSKTEGRLSTATTLSETTHLPEPTVAKVLKLLTKAEILVSMRGANGGYKLASSARSINIADIVMAVDGPISLTACAERAVESCDYESLCPLKGCWSGVNKAVRNALEEVSLADMLGQKEESRRDGSL